MIAADPPRWRFERNSPSFPCRFIAATTFFSHDQAADISATGFLDEFLNENVRVQTTKRLDHALGSLAGFGQNDANALRSFQQFDHQRSAAALLISAFSSYWSSGSWL